MCQTRLTTTKAKVAMVCVAAVALGSSTYAWFANNTKVTATGMQVTATSKQSFLLISSENKTAETIQIENKTTTALTVSEDEAKVLPAAYDASSVTNTTTANTVVNWYTGASDDPSKYELDTNTKESLTAFDGYVIHKQVWITVAKNSNPVKDLTASAKITNSATSEISQAKVLITSESAMTQLDTTTSTSNTVLSSGNIDDATVLPLDIYIYIDGNNTNVFTNNFTNLGTAQINLEFNASLASESNN